MYTSDGCECFTIKTFSSDIIFVLKFYKKKTINHVKE